jgi:putative flippase GtrA
MSLLPHCIESKIARQWHREMLHYLWVGFLATASQYMLLILCVEVFHSSAVLGSSLGYLVGGLVNYVLNRKHTFVSQKKHHKAITQFIIVFTIAFFMNGALLQALQTWAKLHYIPAQILTTTLVLVWNYSAHKFWTFRDV